MPARVPAASMLGRRFGRLLVEAKASAEGQNAARWLCRCDCGRTTTARGTHLRGGRTTSCGCWRREFRAKPAAAITYNSAHYRVKRARGYPSAHRCVDCGEQAQAWTLRRDAPDTHEGDDGRGNPVRYSGRPEDYDPRCHVCHYAYDRGPGGDRDDAGGRAGRPEGRHRGEALHAPSA